MKKWIYVIVPLVLLAAFVFYYRAKTGELDEQARARAEEVAKEKAAEAERKQVIEQKAQQDAEQRAAQAAADEKAKEDAKLAKYNAAMQKIKDDTDAANAEADTVSKRVNDLQAKLTALQQTKDESDRAMFDLAKQVAQAEVDQGNADLENQRYVAMIAQHADQSFLTRMPPPPPPAGN